jgi:ubiquinol-cytochrome c reductase cytochrome c1 subunit
MIKRIAIVLLLVCPWGVHAAGGGGKAAYWEQPKINLGDKASLQRGAKLFANYCMGCHQAQYQRWMHVAEDLGIPEDVIEENLIWTTDADGKKHRAGTLMTNAMATEYGESVFGKAPPDLTLRARSQGADYVYNFLRSFYLESSSPTGVNNAVLKGTAMPHVLWPLQGWQKPVYEGDGHGEDGHIVGFELVKKGSMTPEEYDRAVNDIVNFMVYLGEPARLDRTRIGGWVLFFLVVFLGVAYLLKKEYWKDVH